jgi:hypothetical protein
MAYHGHGRSRRGGHSQDDSVGNRKGPQDMERHLPEDIGNRKHAEDLPHDLSEDYGNRLDGPVPGSRGYLRGKVGRKLGKRPGPYKEMEILYAAQGEGVPRWLRPGFRLLPSGEMAAVQPTGELKPLGLMAHGERVVPAPERHGGDGGAPPRDDAADGPDGHGDDAEGADGKRKRRRRRKRKGEGSVATEGAPASTQAPAQPTGFEEDDESFRYTLKSDPEVKREAALKAVEEVLRNAGRAAAKASARVVQEPSGPRVVVEVDDKAGDGPLFPRGSAALLALTFLVNKIINRFPDDRIRLSVLEVGTYVPPAPPPAAPTGPGPAPSGDAPAPG